jgi:septum formation protein
VDEDSYKAKIEDPTELAQVLANEKAKVIANDHPDAIVIGSDQLAHLEGKVLGKPGNLDNAAKQLEFMSGKTHQLITAVSIHCEGDIQSFCNITSLTMRQLDGDQIKSYLRRDNPIDCAGAYKLELNGISLFEGIETSDHTAITGLPLIEVGNTLHQFGVQIPAVN